jgi:hypothetical protein
MTRDNCFDELQNNQINHQPTNLMTTKGISLHIGLNRVDSTHYGGWDGALTACEADAKDMLAIAKEQKFSSKIVLTKAATSANVISAISSAASALQAGDIFWLTYSGHGGQVPDTNQDEPDRQDETWVLYDRELVDDELYALWGRFKAGVRIAVLSDSCHSGSVVRAMPPRPGRAGAVAARARLMPPDVALRTYRAHQALYDGIQRATPAGENAVTKATVLLISGCQDNQTSLDGARNGLFTEKLRKVWSNGKFNGGYSALHDQIVALMPATQRPNYFKAGTASRKFETQKPFTI